MEAVALQGGGFFIDWRTPPRPSTFATTSACRSRY